jgi:hypothetical protein
LGPAVHSNLFSGDIQRMSAASVFVLCSFLTLAALMMIGKAVNSAARAPQMNGARVAFWTLLIAMVVIPVGLLGYFELFQPSEDLELAYARGGLAGEICSAILPAAIVAGIFSFLFSRRHGKKRGKAAQIRGGARTAR